VTWKQWGRLFILSGLSPPPRARDASFYMLRVKQYIVAIEVIQKPTITTIISRIPPIYLRRQLREVGGNSIREFSRSSTTIQGSEVRRVCSEKDQFMEAIVMDPRIYRAYSHQGDLGLAGCRAEAFPEVGGYHTPPEVVSAALVVTRRLRAFHTSSRSLTSPTISRILPAPLAVWHHNEMNLHKSPFQEFATKIRYLSTS